MESMDQKYIGLDRLFSPMMSQRGSEKLRMRLLGEKSLSKMLSGLHYPVTCLCD